jgi:hypothetical protein
MWDLAGILRESRHRDARQVRETAKGTKGAKENPHGVLPNRFPPALVY